jgi:hypothetical protein
VIGSRDTYARKESKGHGIMALPHSPVHEMKTFDPPSPVPNPWEDLGSWVPVDDHEEEEDYGGVERDDYEYNDEEE